MKPFSLACLGALLVSLGLSLVGCDSGKSKDGDLSYEAQGGSDGCVPECDGTHCGDDGCGNACSCPKGTACNDEGRCEEACDRTCAEAGWECGSLCGELCGECAADQSCVQGKCQLAESPLAIDVISKENQGSKTVVTFAVDYLPRQGEPRAKMASLRIQADKPVDMEVKSISPGQAMEDSQKDLMVYPSTIQAWKMIPENAIKVNIISQVDPGQGPGFFRHMEMEAGRLFTVTLACELTQPTSFSLVRRTGVFSPNEADEVLQNSSYDQAVVVTP